ncbi:MAG: GerAB/ArcD/ProY family transporter [Syntrophomonas sp.]|nr:GerAB/ArcD/ProY family transporter [Syntrophomonas sp.]
MQNDEKLSKEMVFFLIFISVLGNIVYSHTWIDDMTGRTAWLVNLAGILLVIPLAGWILYLGKLSPQNTVFDMVEKSLGKIISSLFLILFIFINALVAIAHINMFIGMLKVYFLPYTPSGLIIISMVLMSVMFISKGLPVFARLIEILVVLGMLNYLSSFIFIIPDKFDTKYMFPLFDTTWLDFLKGTVFVLGETSECLLLLMVIVSFIPDPHKHYKWVSYAITLSGIVFSLATLIIIMMLSPELAKRIAFGGVNAAKLLHVGDYVRGLEILILGTYNFIAIGKITLCLYCAWVAMQKVLGSKKQLLQLFAAALLIIIPAVWIDSYNKGYFLAVFLGNYISLPFSLLLLGLASISIAISLKKAGRVIK